MSGGGLTADQNQRVRGLGKPEHDVEQDPGNLANLVALVQVDGKLGKLAQKLLHELLALLRLLKLERDLFQAASIFLKLPNPPARPEKEQEQDHEPGQQR